jgi:hypothetical protein
MLATASRSEFLYQRAAGGPFWSSTALAESVHSGRIFLTKRKTSNRIFQGKLGKIFSNLKKNREIFN